MGKMLCSLSITRRKYLKERSREEVVLSFVQIIVLTMFSEGVIFVKGKRGKKHACFGRKRESEGGNDDERIADTGKSDSKTGVYRSCEIGVQGRRENFIR